MSINHPYLKRVYQQVCARDPEQPEFLNAVMEVLSTLEPVLEKHPEYEAAGLMERLVEPERMIQFRVAWQDDQGHTQVNRGYRVQYNSAIGPYKGGLRFHPSVNLSIVKFLAFEQIFKNSLTGLPMGGGKGGADFDPKGKSDAEIGVGAREIGYLFGQYKRMQGEFSGILTGKGLTYGGSLVRTQATGYGLLYFVEELLRVMANDSPKDKVTVISGSGNVAIYAAEKALEMGAKVVAMSDSNGCVYDPNGIRLEDIKQIKEGRRGRIQEYLEAAPNAVFYDNCRDIWKIPCEIALPCATQNELLLEDAQALIANGVKLVAEGANMPCSLEAVSALQAAGVLYAPGKAANAGGVATSGLEMCQNAMKYSWSASEVDEKLHGIMVGIFHDTYHAAQEYGMEGNLLAGANIAGFLKVAQAMMAQGIF